MKVKEAIKLVEADGWRLERTRGSHRQYHHPVKPGTVTIAGQPSADLDPKTEIYTEAGRPEMSKYTVFIGKTATGYSAHVPDLPGCIAAAGTLEETRQLITEAIEFHIEGMKLHGEEVPEPTALIEQVEVSV